MSDFKLDTSGTVLMHPQPKDRHATNCIAYRELSPFVQGYVEALFETNRKRLISDPYNGYRARRLGFSDLAPETLARIIEDCEQFSRQFPATFWGREREAGAEMWATRQRADSGIGFRGGEWPDAFAQRLTDEGKGFPPLTVALNDAGKVCFV